MSDRDDGLAIAGARLRKWREDQGLSQVAAAHKIHASQAAWAAWERGEKAPDLHFAFALEALTEGEAQAEDWAFARKGSKASESSRDVSADADDSGSRDIIPPAPNSQTG